MKLTYKTILFCSLISIFILGCKTKYKMVQVKKQYIGNTKLPSNSPIEKRIFGMVEKGDFDRLKSAIDSIADLNIFHEINNITLISTAVQWNQIEMVKLLLSKGADPKLRGSWGNAVCYAVQYYRPEIMQFFMEQGIDPNTTANGGDPLLLYAVGENQIKTVKILLKYGANPNLKSFYRQTPLQSALGQKNTELINILREAGAKE